MASQYDKQCTLIEFSDAVSLTECCVIADHCLVGYNVEGDGGRIDCSIRK
jgi:hypothetical protein